MARLVATRPLRPQFRSLTVVHLEKAEFAIGRARENDASIPFLCISRRHCVLRRRSRCVSEWALRNVGSGLVTINGVALAKDAEGTLRPGDVLELDPRGEFSYELHDDDPTDELMEAELLCPICSEPFHRATLLDCGHSFCDHCLTEWTARKNECPVCRRAVRHRHPNVTVDSVVERLIDRLGPRYGDGRKELVERRETLPPPRARKRDARRPPRTETEAGPRRGRRERRAVARPSVY